MLSVIIRLKMILKQIELRHGPKRLIQERLGWLQGWDGYNKPKRLKCIFTLYFIVFRGVFEFFPFK